MHIAYTYLDIINKYVYKIKRIVLFQIINIQSYPKYDHCNKCVCTILLYLSNYLLDYYRKIINI